MNSKDKFVTDLHQHSTFSYDGRQNAEDVVKKAIENGDKRVCFSEHYDYDCFLLGISGAPLVNPDEYKAEITRLKAKYSDKIEILFGIEFGYSKEAVEKYRELTEKYDFDYVINSVHLLYGKDCCKKEFLKKDKVTAYGDYLKTVLESVNADYKWQIVGHLSYPVRYATYENRELLYDEHREIIDEILNTIIRRNKYLEINTSTKDERVFSPEIGIVKRYIDLGSENFTYGSDSHDLSRYREKCDKVAEVLASFGKTASFFRKMHPVAE